jgi:hypothetical protein
VLDTVEAVARLVAELGASDDPVYRAAGACLQAAPGLIEHLTGKEGARGHSLRISAASRRAAASRFASPARLWRPVHSTRILRVPEHAIVCAPHPVGADINAALLKLLGT